MSSNKQKGLIKIDPMTNVLTSVSVNETLNGHCTILFTTDQSKRLGKVNTYPYILNASIGLHLWGTLQKINLHVDTSRFEETIQW